MFKIAPFLSLLGFLSVVSAHFQLQFPPPRGVFVENNEPTFCDGYPNVASNRTQFPIGNTSISFNSEHPKWTFGVLLTTVQNPTSFDNFSQVVPFFQAAGEGPICLALDLATTNATGLSNGVNATLQFVFDGGDGQLFQCADIVLSSTLTVSQGSVCNSSATIPTTSGVSAGAPSSTSPASSSGAPAPTGSSSAALLTQAGGVSVLMSALGVVLALM